MNTKRGRTIAVLVLCITLLSCVSLHHGVAYAEEFDVAPEEVGENAESYSLSAESDPIAHNGIPVLTLDIDPDEYQKVIVACVTAGLFLTCWGSMGALIEWNRPTRREKGA